MSVLLPCRKATCDWRSLARTLSITRTATCESNSNTLLWIIHVLSNTLYFLLSGALWTSCTWRIIEIYAKRNLLYRSGTKRTINIYSRACVRTEGSARNIRIDKVCSDNKGIKALSLAQTRHKCSQPTYYCYFYTSGFTIRVFST